MPVFINNRFVSNDDAMLHVSDLSMQRGYGVFDFFRVSKGMPLFMEDHLQRFFTSAKAMHLSVAYNDAEIKAIILELIQKNQLADCGVRIMLTGGYAPDGYTIAAPNLAITCNPVVTAGDEDFEKGYSVISFEHQRELPHIKSINYQMAVWLQPLLKEKKANDVLYHYNGLITEFPRSNVFIITKENVLVTPKRNILPGVTRKNILRISPSLIKTEERDITLEEVVSAKEVFLSSTTKKILPVIKINEVSIGEGKPGLFTRKLRALFTDQYHA